MAEQRGRETDAEFVGPTTIRRSDCGRLLRLLPEWFGIESALLAYVDRVERRDGFVASVDGEVVGFVAIERNDRSTAEIDVMAVRPDLRGCGVGSGLLAAAEAWLKKEKVGWLEVKTIGPSSADRRYAETRAFYEARGFVIAEDLPDEWGADNPCVLMRKAVPAATKAR